jgi:16S rRNA (cytidine1402-2'-O)-methyltransferase
LLVYNDYSDETLRIKIINKLLNGENIALVSDAGTPLISDPGYKLVHDLKQHDIKVETLPGACSVISALTISGLPTDRFMFIGFLPHKASGKESIFSEIKEIKSTMVCFESANRLLSSLELMKGYFGNRKVAVVREISKIYEESSFGTLDEVIYYYQENKDKLRGEIVLCIGPGEGEELNEDGLLRELAELMKKMSLRDAVDAVRSQHNLPKKQIYKLALTIE